MKFKKQGKNQDPAICTAWKKKSTNKQRKIPRKQQNNNKE